MAPDKSPCQVLPGAKGLLLLLSASCKGPKVRMPAYQSKRYCMVRH